MKKFLILATILFLQIIFVNPSYAIKIGLQNDIDRTYIGSSTVAPIINTHTNHTIYTLAKMQGYEIRAYHDLIAIKIQGQYYNLGTNSISIKPTGSGYISAKGRWYRGSFIVNNRNGSLTVINKLDIESYIKGVVPSEMPSSWAHEAHKAQAVAARSYALANMGKRAGRGYDVKDTPEG